MYITRKKQEFYIPGIPVRSAPLVCIPPIPLIPSLVFDIIVLSGTNSSTGVYDIK